MTADCKTIIRRIVDYLHKYATPDQIFAVARILNVSTETKPQYDASGKIK